MSLRGLDTYITREYDNTYDEYYGTWICAFCIASDHKHCVSKHCGCPYRSPGDRTRMGREHQRKRGKLALVMDKATQRYAWDEPGWAEADGEGKQPGPQEGAGLAKQGQLCSVGGRSYLRNYGFVGKGNNFPKFKGGKWVNTDE